jgi:amidohydrolase
MKSLGFFEKGMFCLFVLAGYPLHFNAQSVGINGEDTCRGLAWQRIDDLCLKVSDKVITWRRDFHQNPELGNREFRTSKTIAEHLGKLGLEVHAGIAHTGVIGILRGKSDGPVIALRADMDALPVKELTDLPFASKVTASYNGKEVPVMHACGHDAHTAILMGVAEVLSQVRNELPGTVKFIFQPAEDSKPENEEGGAEFMIKEGVLENPKVEAIFALHVTPYPASTLSYRSGGIFAAVDNFNISVKGRQTHGAMPWTGIDAIPVSAQIVLGLQTIVSRQIDLTEEPAFISIGTIHGGTQRNILSGEVEMQGTLRTFSASRQKDIQDRIKRTANSIAESSGATADVSFYIGVPVVYNDPKLTGLMTATLNKVAQNTGIFVTRPITVGDDFSCYTRQTPGMYFLLGVAPEGADPAKIVNHSPFFMVDESALVKGVEALSHLSVDYLSKKMAD